MIKLQSLMAYIKEHAPKEEAHSINCAFLEGL